MNKKNLWSILAIMMVSVLSFGFVACGDDDDDDNKNNDVVSTYSLDYDVLDEGNLSEDEVSALEGFLEDNIEGETFENVSLGEVVNQVKAMVKGFQSEISENFPGKSFKLSIDIDDEATKTCVKSVVVSCKNGKLSV